MLTGSAVDASTERMARLLIGMTSEVFALCKASFQQVCMRLILVKPSCDSPHSAYSDAI